MRHFFKKILPLAIITILAVSAMPKTVWAEAGDCNRDFLGLTPWSCGVDINSIGSSNELKNGIWTIVGNISIDATVIASYLALGFVIYGGFLYMFSTGDTGKVAQGKKTLTSAFIGLGIVLLANVIFSAMRGALGVSLTGGVDTGVNAGAMVQSAIEWVIGISGVVAAIFLVYGGVSYMTSAGDAGKLAKAKNTIVYALIGLAIVGLAELIVGFVSTTINNANNSATEAEINTLNSIAKIKEVYEK